MVPGNRANFVLLVVLDGWGIAPPGPGNAISLANTPNFKRFWASYPHTELKASGEAVGLPGGEVGNTETGHLNIGAGKIIYQDLARINISIADGSFFENESLNAACAHSVSNNSSLHLMGLVGAGGAHSSMEHLFSLIRLARMKGVKKLFIHAFTDGRDSPPNASLTYISQLEEVLAHEGIGEIATIMGRYFAMDRDRRWERTEKAYMCLTAGLGRTDISATDAIKKSYENSITDEFLEPTVILRKDNSPKGLVRDNDAVIFFNFRVDRPRQLTYAFVRDEKNSHTHSFDFDPYAVEYEHTHVPVEKSTEFFKRGKRLQNLFFVTMTEYSKLFPQMGTHVAFPPEAVKMTLGRIISLNNLKQLRVAESEKERFVTYYFNGLSEKAEIGEERLIVPSPKVATYDQKPEMAADSLTNELYARLVKSTIYSFVLVNFANPDMVGHTGNIPAAVKAVEAVDRCLGQLARFVISYGGTMLVTGDHGNAEEMLSAETGGVQTEHSDSSVPFIAISREFVGQPQVLPAGILADIAPTVLTLMKVPVPSSMTGRNLLASLMKKR